MKLIAPLAAAAGLAASLVAAPVFAHERDQVHYHPRPHEDRAIFKHSRHVNQEFEIDPSILYPLPRPRLPIPVPGPCLSCPPFDLNPNEIGNPVLR